jgi:hypothetical protein
MKRPAWAVGALPLVLLSGAGCRDGRAAEVELQSPQFLAAPEGVRIGATRALGPLKAATDAIAAGPMGFSLDPEGPAYLLAGPEDVDVDGDGNLWVVDAMQRELLGFDGGGALIGRYGRRGRGPGEYESPGSVMRLPWNDHLAVWDATLQRLTFLTSGGRVERTVSLAGADVSPIPGLGQAAKRLRTWSGGFVLERHSDPLRTPPAEQLGHLLLLDTLAQVTDTILTFAVPVVHAQNSGESAGNHTTWQAPPAFAPEAHWDVFPDGTIAFAPGGPYALYLFLPLSGEALQVRRDWTPERVTRRDRLRRLEMERDDGRIGRSSMATALIERVTRDRFARIRPTITGVLADPAGRLWVRRFDTAADGAGRSPVWDVYALTGDPLGTVRFEPRFLPRRIDGLQVLGIRRDSLGVRSVAAYPIPRFSPQTNASR